MEDFLDYIEKYKFAIIGTAAVHILFFFYANFTTVDRPFKFPDPEIEMEVPLDNVEIDEETLKEMEMNQNQQQSEEIYNLAADAADNREKSYENYSTQEMDQQVEQEAKALEEQYFKEWAASHESDNRQHSSSNNDTQEDNSTKNNNVDESTIKTGGSNAFAGEVLVSYYLTDRKAHDLPKPGYTCNSSGTVVVDVRVDKSGNVKTASYNQNMSRSATECMINKAISYAKKSRFNFSSSASTWQNGTITYKFVSG